MAKTHAQLIKKLDRSDKYGRLFLYIALFMVIALSFATFLLQTQARESAAKDRRYLQELGQQNNELAEQIKVLGEQNKKLAEDNIYLADRKIFYLKCLGRMFVLWTKEQPPLKLDNLTKCEFTVNRESYSQTFNPTGNGTRSESPTKNSTNTSTEAKKRASAPARPQPTPTEPPTPQPAAQVCTINLLGIKLLCREGE
jgi:hypothetical protein